MKETGMANIHDRLVLGTVQLGMSYGIANDSGQPDYQQAREIIAAAWQVGIKRFDTAQGYGQSESVLAKALVELDLVAKVKIFSKIHPAIDHADFNALRQAIKQSRTLFGSSLHCIMLHREEFLQQWSDGLGEMLRECRDEGFFSSIGISVYDPAAARRALETEGIDLVQLPANILDRRHEQAGVMALARKLCKTIMIRSVFLQGALLLPTTDLPARILHARSYLESVASLARQYEMTPRDLAMTFARDQWADCLVVFGAELPNQVLENAASWGRAVSARVLKKMEKLSDVIPLEVLRPDLWEDPHPLAVGNRLLLRRLRPSDAYGEYLRWMNDPVITRYLESRFRIYTTEDLEKYILNQRNNPSVLFLAIEEIASGRHVGNIKIGPRHAVHGTAELGFLIGAKECWGKGYATEAIALALGLAFEKFAVRKIIAGCYSVNKAAEIAFIRNSFIKEGLMHRNALNGNMETDVVLFGLLKDDWRTSTIN